LLWDALADLLGSAAAAVLLRRAARRATGHSPVLAELAIVREKLDYAYTLPAAWHESTEETDPALQLLVGQLLPLLAELTGPVGVRHLARVRGLRKRGLIPAQEETP
jgi:hypothetical protein